MRFSTKAVLSLVRILMFLVKIMVISCWNRRDKDEDGKRKKMRENVKRRSRDVGCIRSRRKEGGARGWNRERDVTRGTTWGIDRTAHSRAEPSAASDREPFRQNLCHTGGVGEGRDCKREVHAYTQPTVGGGSNLQFLPTPSRTFFRHQIIATIRVEQKFNFLQGKS